jgi:hypothetical protein
MLSKQAPPVLNQTVNTMQSVTEGSEKERLRRRCRAYLLVYWEMMNRFDQISTHREFQEAHERGGRASPLAMNPPNVTIKVLDSTAVFCQRDGCEKPAVYLFSAASTRPLCTAHCGEHAQDFANRLGFDLQGRTPLQTWRWVAASD